MQRESQRRSVKDWLRLLAIPALLIVLVAVVFWPSQAGSGTDESSVPTPRAARVRTAALVSINTPVWPAAHIEDIIAFNPFTPPIPAPAPAAAGADPQDPESAAGEPSAERRRAAELQNSNGKLQAIYIDDRGAAAIVNSRVLRVGDLLPGGDRIVAITPQGIQLAEDGSDE